MNTLIVQPELKWEDPETNLHHIQDLIESDWQEANLILLPEMFTTGFTMNASQLAEEENGKAVNWMRSMARKLNAALCGSIIFKTDNAYFNRLFWINPDSSMYVYDKRHLFSIGGEDRNFTRGRSRKVFEYRDFTIMPLICYDLRFPVWSRNISGYDILIYLANWPAVRNDVWETLLKARAIENQAYVIGVNRVGTDGEGITYIGNSRVYDPKGKLLLELPDMEMTGRVSLDLEELRLFRSKFPVLKDRDDFEIIQEP